MKKLTSEELDKIAQVCAVQKGLYPEEHGLMLIRMRRLPDDGHSGIAGDPRWEIDLPTTGSTYYGHTPEEAFRNALDTLVKEHADELEKAKAVK